MNYAVIFALLIFSLFIPVVHALPASGPDDVQFAGTDRPGGDWDGMPVRAGWKDAEPLWSLRTGLRKGVIDLTLEEERFAAPDAAILRSGAFREWTGLLAEFQEPSVLIGPADLAGLVRTKPVLIIPSGGLAGTSGSAYFQAGLAEYVRSGGVVLCFAQRNGRDYVVLPVPPGPKLEAAGWAEDAGPLFRSSTGQAIHPILSSTRKPVPAIDTDGYITTSPDGATVLLARPDGLPTFVLYPFGGGWVAVTTLFSDVSFGQGLLHDEERALVRNLVLWAKAGGRMTHSIPGGRFSLRFTVPAPDQGTAASVKVMLIGPSRQQPLDVRTMPVIAGPGKPVTVSYAHETLGETPSGMYHLEYVLLDENGRQLAPVGESADGWVDLSSNAARGTIVPRQKPLAAPAARFSVVPSIGKAGDRTRLKLEVERTAGPAGSYELLARTGSAQTTITITGDRGTGFLDLPSMRVDRLVAWAVSHADGRSVARGALPSVPAKGPGVSVDRPSYLPGQKIAVSVAGMGSGEVTLSGLGAVLTQYISGDRTLEMTVPASLPAGVYPIAWEFQTRAGERREGEVSIMISGARVTCTDASLLPQAARDGPAVTLALRLFSSQALQAVLNLWPVGPDDKDLPGRERSLPLAAGSQDATLTLPFTPAQAGIGQFRYTITATLPEGAGLSREPVLLAAGRVLHDAGDAAVLGLWTDRALYYDPVGPVQFSASVSGKGRAKVQLSLDGKRLRRESIETPGTADLTVPLTKLAPGRHTLRATAESSGLESSRELRFLYGARLPDLYAIVRTSDATAPVMEVGVSVMNRGKIASGRSQAALYEGDPDKGGALIEKFTVPPLEPGKQNVVIIKWPLAGKAGPRTLFAVADRDAQVLESDEENNTASVSFTVPEVLVTLTTDKAAYRTDEQARYRIAIVNFTAEALPASSLAIQVSDPAGKVLPPDLVGLPALTPGDQKVIDRVLELTAPQEGAYLVSARATFSSRTVASDSLGISILPTLLLRGSLEGTPSIAAPCRPFTFRYQARNAGNVQPTNGSLKLEVRSTGQGHLAYAQQPPFSLDAGTVKIGRFDMPRGAYTVTLRGSAVNQQRNMTADFLLAEQPLTVSGPAEVRRVAAAFPRVLVWAGGESTAVERALVEKILQEAFESESVYIRMVTSADDFTNLALSGLYTTYALLDVDGLPDIAEVLRQGLAKGHGIVLAGSGERTRAIAEQLDFRFGDPLPGSGTNITFPADSGLGITGTLPVSGGFLPPRKRGARAMATLADGQPAILFDARDKGKVLVLPFSLTRSARHTGSTTLYSLLARSAVLTAAPDQVEQEDIVSVQLLVSSPSGPVRTRITETLPPGASVVWTNLPHTMKGRSLSFELTADTDPQRVLSLIQTGEPASAKTAIEVFAECDGKFVSQGKVE